MIENPPLYPLKFHPILKEKVWGGSKLRSLLEKQASGQVGESWEISGVENNISIVANGCFEGKSLTELLETFGEKLVGGHVFKTFGKVFPLLFKFIDAQEDLSVQLHPNDALAKARHGSFGKSEMWYIVNAEKNARLILGFNREMNENLYSQHLAQGKLLDILHEETVKKGDAFLITPGIVHAIGGGIVLAEIQQTSDITYRIYDWERPDINGELRELHLDLALKAIDFKKTNEKLKYVPKMGSATNLCSTPFFEVNKLKLDISIERNLRHIQSFTVYMCVEGSGTIEANGFETEMKIGETLLVPACLSEISIKTTAAVFLEIYVP